MSLNAVEVEMIKMLIERANEAQRDVVRDLLASMKPKLTAKPNASAVDIDRPLRIGDRVIFKGRKTKPPVIGTIKSMNDKTFTITDCSDGGPGWRMPPAMLKRYVGA
jgi:hypothetical protein